jgi:hypothetical protein
VCVQEPKEAQTKALPCERKEGCRCCGGQNIVYRFNCAFILYLLTHRDLNHFNFIFSPKLLAKGNRSFKVPLLFARVVVGVVLDS